MMCFQEQKIETEECKLTEHFPDNFIIAVTLFQKLGNVSEVYRIKSLTRRKKQANKLTVTTQVKEKLVFLPGEPLWSGTCSRIR